MKLSIAAAVCLLAECASAKPPPAPAYQMNLTVFPSQPSYANTEIAGFIDETDTTISSAGSPHPVSQSEPFPVVFVPLSTAPTSFSQAMTTTAVAVSGLPAGIYRRINFVIQGSGNGCYSFTSPSVSIAGSTCTNGYPVTGGSVFASSSAAIPNTQLYVVEATGGTLSINGDFQ